MAMIMIPQKASEDASDVCFQSSCTNLYKAFPADFFATPQDKNELISTISPLADLMLCQGCYTLPYIFIGWVHSIWDVLQQMTSGKTARRNYLNECRRMKLSDFISLTEMDIMGANNIPLSLNGLPLYDVWKSSVEYMAETFAQQLMIKLQYELAEFYSDTIESIQCPAGKGYDDAYAAITDENQTAAEFLLQTGIEQALARSLSSVAEIYNLAYFKSPILLQSILDGGTTVGDTLAAKDMTENNEFMAEMAEKATVYWSRSNKHRYKL